MLPHKSTTIRSTDPCRVVQTGRHPDVILSVASEVRGCGARLPGEALGEEQRGAEAQKPNPVGGCRRLKGQKHVLGWHQNRRIRPAEKRVEGVVNR